MIELESFHHISTNFPVFVFGFPQGIIHKRLRMNPKAIRAEEMFGETDRLSGEVGVL